MPEHEYRIFPVELRVTGGDTKKLEGHAAVFNQLSEDLGGFKEQIAPGAFSKAINRDDVRALFNHDPNYILARNRAGTLKLEEDTKGLRFEVNPPNTTWAKDLMVSMERGDISQCSFGFRVVKDTWQNSPDEIIRTLNEVELFDVSIVTYPAYPQTDAQVRSTQQVYNDFLASQQEPGSQNKDKPKPQPQRTRASLYGLQARRKELEELEELQGGK